VPIDKLETHSVVFKKKGNALKIKETNPNTSSLSDFQKLIMTDYFKEEHITKVDYGDLIIKVNVNIDERDLIYVTKLDKQVYFTLNHEINLLEAM
jgi:hypothetical protein